MQEMQEMGVQSLGQKDPKGQRNLEGYSPWNCKESDTTEHMCTHTHMHAHTHTHTHTHTHRVNTSWISLFHQKLNITINTKIMFS